MAIQQSVPVITGGDITVIVHSFDPVSGNVLVTYDAVGYDIQYTYNMQVPIVNSAYVSEAEFYAWLNDNKPISAIQHTLDMEIITVPPYLVAFETPSA